MEWTCPECGVEYGAITPENAAGRLRDDARGYSDVVSSAPDAALRERPEPQVWSALEYTMHAADVVDVLADVVAAIAEGRSLPDLWDQDERAESHSYNERDTVEALQFLDAAVEKSARTFAAIDEFGWGRSAEFPFGERDALTMMQNAVHESKHHLQDARRSLERVSAGSG